MQEKKFGTVLVADSDKDISNLIGMQLYVEKVAENIISTTNRDAQRSVLENCPIELVIVDFKDGGKEIIKTARKIRPEIKILVYSGSVIINLRNIVMEIGADLLLLKPTPKDDFICAVRNLLKS